MPLPKISTPIFNTILKTSGQKVDFRPMQAREDRLLLQLRAGNPEDAEILATLAQVVQLCLLDSKINAMSLPIADLEWLFIQIRMKSVSEIANVSYIDNSDKRTYDFEIPLKDVTLEQSDISHLLDIGDGIALELRWPSVADTIAVSSLPPVDVAHQLAVRSVAKVFDNDEVTETKDITLEEVDEFVNGLPVKTYQDIMDHLAATPRLNYKIEYTNSKKEQREIILSTLSDFFTFV